LEDILLWAKSNTGRSTNEPQIFGFNEICNEIIQNLNHQATEKRITINNLQHIDIKLFAFKNMIKTVIRNLISNAIKYTNINGNITIRTEKDDRF